MTGNPSFYWHRLTSDNLTTTRKNSLYVLIPWNWVRDCCRKGASCLSLCLCSDWDASLVCPPVHSALPWAGGAIVSAVIPVPAVGKSLWELLGCPDRGSRGTARVSVTVGD